MISFIKERCQRWLYNKANCRLCLDACPVEECVKFVGGSIFVNQETCIGCGICSSTCPTSALVMEGLTDRELWNRLNTHLKSADESAEAIEDTSLLFGCSLGTKVNEISRPTIVGTPKSQIANLINLPCLAILKESHLISLILSGTSDIYLDLSRCSGCSFKHSKTTIEKTIAYAKNLLDAIGYYDRIKFIPSNQEADKFPLPVPSFNSSPNKRGRIKVGDTKRVRGKRTVKTIIPEPEYSRRELLSFFRAKAVEKAVEKFAGIKNKKIEKGCAGEEQGIPDRRKILMGALKGNNVLQPAQVEEGEFPVHQLRIQDNCTLCRICSLYCPTGAIERFEDNGEVRIDFQMTLCMGCYQCKELCPEGAMYYEEEIDLELFLNNEIKTIIRKIKSECPECGRPFISNEGMEGCLNCRKKKNLDKRIIGIMCGNG